jgi:hypothetical protein
LKEETWFIMHKLAHDLWPKSEFKVDVPDDFLCGSAFEPWNGG